jgi:gluconolactonase
MKFSSLSWLTPLLFATTVAAQHGVEFQRPDAIVDLRTNVAAASVKGQWRYSDARIVEVNHRLPGPDLKPTGAPSRTHDIEPKAGVAGFDDSKWDVIEAASLEQRRTTGRFAFGWYRLNVTLPEKVGAFSVAGATVYFEIVVDDYAEVWVNGKLPETLGQAGGHMIRGWNAPNRVMLTRNARPGEQIQLAVFAANGPLSNPPANFVWVRSAALDFYSPEHARVGEEVATEIVRADSALDHILAPGTKIERIATGFGFTEGPVWVPGEAGEVGHLLFSDPNNNTIYRWSTDGQVSIFRTHSGYTGADIGDYHQPGSNGLSLDPQGRLTICEHGNRRVTRLEKNGVLTVLADRFEGKRLNSPNDQVHRSDGALFFTDPPFGLPKVFDDARKELPFSGVYGLIDGKLKLLSTDFTGPNGLAFSPDEKYLYVDNWDTAKKVVKRYEVAADGTLSNGKVFFDVTGAPGEEALDGLKVDREGNVYFSGPGGVWIVSPEGKHVGTLKGPELPANFTFGDADGKTLYLCARKSVYRVRLGVSGARPIPAQATRR